MKTQTTLEALPPRITSATEYGSDYDVRRWLGELADDERWDARSVVGRDGGKVVGCLPIWRSTLSRTPQNEITRELTTLGLPNDVPCLHLGPHSRKIGGAAVVRRRDRWASEECLTALIRRATEEAQAIGLRPVALYVPHSQLAAFLRSWPTPPRVHPADMFSRLEVEVDSSGRVHHASKRVRDVWTHDARAAEDLRLERSWSQVTKELIAEAAPLVAAVSRNNGAIAHHRLSAYQLEKWWTFDSQSARALSVRTSGGELAGVTFARLRESALEVYEVGMPDEFEQRRFLYATLCFVEPLKFVAANGLTTIELGTGHSSAKRSRGAEQELLWHIY